MDVRKLFSSEMHKFIHSKGGRFNSLWELKRTQNFRRSFLLGCYWPLCSLAGQHPIVRTTWFLPAQLQAGIYPRSGHRYPSSHSIFYTCCCAPLRWSMCIQPAWRKFFTRNTSISRTQSPSLVLCVDVFRGWSTCNICSLWREKAERVLLVLGNINAWSCLCNTFVLQDCNCKSAARWD